MEKPTESDPSEEQGEREALEFSLGLRKSVIQHTFSENVDMVVRVNTFYTVLTNQIASIQIKFQLTDDIKQTVAQISLCDVSPDMLKSLGRFLLETAEKL